MNNRTIYLLNSLTIPSLKTFDDRLRMQKIVYLAREKGFDAGYSFSWHRRGPYSPSLTRMLFSSQEQNTLINQDYTLQDSERRIIDELKSFLGEDIENPHKLELLASIIYYMPHKPLTPKKKEELVVLISDLKPEYEEDEIIETIDRAKKFRD